MPGLSGNQQAYRYAIVNACVFDSTRFGYYRPLGLMKVAGVDRSRNVDRHTLRIVDVIDQQTNTATLDVFGFIPVKGQEIVISLGTHQNKLFAGYILNVTQQAPNKEQRLRFTLNCADYTWQLDTRRILGRSWTNTSATRIIHDIIDDFAPAFSALRVEVGMENVNFTANHAETISQAITRLMSMIGGYWYVDYDRTVHAFVTPEPGTATTTASGDNYMISLGLGAPAAIPPMLTMGLNPGTVIYTGAIVLTANLTTYWRLRHESDVSQVRTRVHILGGTTTTTSPVPSGSAEIPVEDTSLFSVASPPGFALSFGNQVSYAGTSPASGPGWITGVSSLSYAIPQGESVRVLVTRSNTPAANSIAALMGSGTGFIEETVDDERLSVDGALTRADGELATFAAPSETIRFYTRDRAVTAGRLISASIVAPNSLTVVGNFLTQEVVIRDVDFVQGEFPVREVTAGVTDRNIYHLLGQLH
jgi:hypothetical protein